MYVCSTFNNYMIYNIYIYIHNILLCMGHGSCILILFGEMQARPLRNLKKPSHRCRSDLGIRVLVLYMVGHILPRLTLAFCLAESRLLCCKVLFCFSCAGWVYMESEKIQEHKWEGTNPRMASKKWHSIVCGTSIGHLMASLLTAKCVSARYYCIFASGLRSVWQHGGSC